ncbi:hypothetical protein B0H17DRAFT_1104164, partial [Mycena rosella]
MPPCTKTSGGLQSPITSSKSPPARGPVASTAAPRGFHITHRGNAPEGESSEAGADSPRTSSVRRGARPRHRRGSEPAFLFRSSSAKFRCDALLSNATPPGSPSMS